MLELIDRRGGFRARSRVHVDRVGDGLGASVVQITPQEAQAHQRRRAPLRAGRAVVGEPIAEVAAHVVQQQIAVCPHRLEAQRRDRTVAGRQDGQVAVGAADLIEEEPAPTTLRCERQRRDRGQEANKGVGRGE